MKPLSNLCALQASNEPQIAQISPPPIAIQEIGHGRVEDLGQPVQ